MQPGLAQSHRLQAEGLIDAAVLACQGQAFFLEPARTLPLAA
jgi:hypothetical protein